MESLQGLRVAVDIGGTFTDVAVADRTGEIVAAAKTPTTSDDPTAGAMTVTRDALSGLRAGFGDVAGFVHGTTLATNALIERRGACVAAVTTDGFRDILEIGYERRYSQYDVDLDKPDLIVPRSRCFTVPERISARGETLTPLDERASDPLVRRLDACGAESVAVCLLHSYANPSHEQRVRELLTARRPDLFVSLSCEVSPEAREFERLCTTVANAYVQPLMSTYLSRFEAAFQAAGLRCPVLLMTSGGGMTSVEIARRAPIRLVESGPSGGAVLAAMVAERAGLPRVLSFDMGGTTAKLCLIDDFQPQTSRQFEISRAARFVKGSGMPARIPVVEMVEIGAGGGSIAGVDGLRRLTVGPRSAGAEPGPAAFGRGGADATVTDADVVLGYIEPDGFAEGRLAIDARAAASALSSGVGAPLGIPLEEAAIGVSQIVDEAMASAGRMHAVESGKDLSGRVLIAFGGNGPLHATRLARRTGVKAVLVPPDPGVGSAVGFLHAPVSFEIVRSRYSTLGTLDVDDVNALFAGMIDDAQGAVRAAAPEDALLTARSAFMRYHGQGHEIEIPLPDRALSADDTEELVDLFESAYRAQFTRAVPGMTIEVLNWAVRVSTVPRPVMPLPEAAATFGAPPRAHRTIRCDETGEEIRAAVYRRCELAPGATLAGPALVVEPQTTTLVGAGFRAAVDAGRNLLVARDRA